MAQLSRTRNPEDFSATETVVSITNEGEVLDRGMDDQLLGGETEMEDSDAEKSADNDRIAEIPSDEELNTEGYSAKVVAGIASDEEIDMGYQSDPQSERLEDLHAEEVQVTGGIPSDEELLNTADYSDSQNEISNTFSARQESRTSGSLQSSQEIETLSEDVENHEEDRRGYASEKRDHVDTGDADITTPNEPRDAEVMIGGSSPPDSDPSGELSPEQGRFLADEL